MRAGSVAGVPGGVLHHSQKHFKCPALSLLQSVGALPPVTRGIVRKRFTELGTPRPSKVKWESISRNIWLILLGKRALLMDGTRESAHWEWHHSSRSSQMEVCSSPCTQPCDSSLWPHAHAPAHPDGTPLCAFASPLSPALGQSCFPQQYSAPYLPFFNKILSLYNNIIHFLALPFRNAYQVSPLWFYNRDIALLVLVYFSPSLFVPFRLLLSLVVTRLWKLAWRGVLNLFSRDFIAHSGEWTEAHRIFNGST